MRCGPLQPRAQRSQPRHFANVDRHADAFDPSRSQRFEREVALDQFAHRLTDHESTPGSPVSASRDARLVEWPIGVYSVCASSVSIDRTTTSPVFTPIRTCRLTPFSARSFWAWRFTSSCIRSAAYSALRMVLVGHRSAEQCENAVAGRLRNISAVAMHRRHHKMQYRVDDRARLLGIEIAHQLGRSLDVGEQRRHRFALTIGILPPSCPTLTLMPVGSSPTGFSVQRPTRTRYRIPGRTLRWLGWPSRTSGIGP